LLKRCDFIVAIVKAARAGSVDIKKICWSTIRGRKIQAYLDNNSLKKSHLGARNILLMGFDQPGISDDENLQGIESHGRELRHEEINQFEAFAVDGQVPNPKRQHRERTDDWRLGAAVADWSRREG
jgi:hypothetical protein